MSRSESCEKLALILEWHRLLVWLYDHCKRSLQVVSWKFTKALRFRSFCNHEFKLTDSARLQLCNSISFRTWINTSLVRARLDYRPFLCSLSIYSIFHPWKPCNWQAAASFHARITSSAIPSSPSSPSKVAKSAARSAEVKQAQTWSTSKSWYRIQGVNRGLTWLRYWKVANSSLQTTDTDTLLI